MTHVTHHLRKITFVCEKINILSKKSKKKFTLLYSIKNSPSFHQASIFLKTRQGDKTKIETTMRWLKQNRPIWKMIISPRGTGSYFCIINAERKYCICSTHTWYFDQTSRLTNKILCIFINYIYTLTEYNWHGLRKMYVFVYKYVRV